jgi:Peptidase inhibitor I78 family
MRQARRFTGVVYKAQVRENLARAIHHNRIRLIRPGSVITQDLRPDRMNLILDDAGKIMTIRCG